MVLAAKLRSVKAALRTWSHKVFGNIFDSVKVAEDRALNAKLSYDTDPFEANLVALREAEDQLWRSQGVEHMFWQQKSRIKWLKDGDRNSRYFHSVVAKHRQWSVIHRIKSSDREWLESAADIEGEATTFFRRLFTAESPSESFDALDVIPKLITSQDNAMLEEVPSKEEVKSVVFAMDGESAAGPDGFSGKFFTCAWDIVAEDVHAAVVCFFCGEVLPRSIFSTSIVLISKVQPPQDFTQFRPISLCNFINKVISKLLSDRLARILSKIISPQQSGFIKGRHMSDNFLLAQELLSGIRHSHWGGNVVLKLDMAKAYDHVSWLFLLQVLRRFGFAESGVKSTLQQVMRVMETYYGTSGQQINCQKSCFIVDDALSSSRRRVVSQISGFHAKLLPLKYLCCTLYSRRSKSSHFSEICTSVASRVLTWKEKLLSPRGRLVLISSVVSSMPLHILAASAPPKGVLCALEKVFANFLWGRSEGGNRYDWIGWESLCKPSIEGGVGVRALADVFDSFSVKLWWSLRQRKSLWAEFMHSKYLYGLHACEAEFQLSQSPTWRRLVRCHTLAESYIQWVLQNGMVDFWHENWIGAGSLCQRVEIFGDHSVADFVFNGSWNLSMLRQWLPDSIIAMIV
nr:uncharacterized protein LOC113711437 [Coffea arabica]